MWGGTEGIADNLAREFRAMSAERDRRLGLERARRADISIDGSSYYQQSGGATNRRGRGRTSPILRYSTPERYLERGKEEQQYNGYRRYSGRDGGGNSGVSRRWREDARAAPLEGRRTSKRETTALRSAPSSRTNSRAQRRGDDDWLVNRRSKYDPSEVGTTAYSYSYSYSSSSDGNPSDNDEERFARRGEKDRYARGTEQKMGRGHSPTTAATGHRSTRAPAPCPEKKTNTKQKEKSKAMHQVRYTPTAPSDSVSETRLLNAPAAVTPNALSDERYVVVREPQPQSDLPAIQPSAALQRVVASVAYYRGVPVPATIPSEVTLAFDEYVSRGSTMLKFLPHGPPHARFFAIRFLDVSPGGRNANGSGAEASVPHAVLGWYQHSSSRHMIRFLPLHDLLEVKAEGASHPYVKRRTVQPGVLRGPRNRLTTQYVYAEFILQLCFRSQLSNGEEALALKAVNRTQYLAWLVVGTFLSMTGGGIGRPLGMA